MAISTSNKRTPGRSVDPGKTGDLSAASSSAAASSSRPHKRPARGSEVAKREKKERRAARKQGASTSRVQGSASARGTGGGPGKGAVSDRRRAGGPRATEGSDRAKRGKASRAPQQDLMRYASDNALVRWFYALTTGPRRHLFYLGVVLLVLAGIYGPVRDLYVARRTVMILEEQTAIRKEYNEALGDEVGGLMSQEGIEDAARKDLGMVMPGEQTITVEGLDDEGNPVVVDPDKQDASGQGAASGGEDPAAEPEEAGGEEDSGKLKGSDAADKSKTGSGPSSKDPSKHPTTSAEVEAAERAVLENSAWYWKVLDAIFFFDGANGMAVVSTGE